MLERHTWAPERRGSDRHRDEREFISFSDLRRFFYRYWQTVAACTVAAFLAAAIYLAFATPIFTAKVQLLIESNIPQTFREQTSDTLSSLDAPQVESQLAILRSERVAQKVVESLGLLENLEPTPEPSGLMALLSWLRGTKTEAPTDAQKLQEAIAHVRSRLDVDREGLSYAINISYRSTDPETAAQFANAIAVAYVEDRLETRTNAAQQGSKWLEERIDDLRRQMNAAALDVQQFKAKRDYRIVGRNEKTPPARTKEAGSEGDATSGDTDHTLEELESRADTYRKIYESYLQAYAETVQRQSYPVTNARVITPATRPNGKSHPRTLLTLVFGAGFGGLVGLGIAFVLNSLDRKLRTPRQVREELGLECLGQVAHHDTSMAGPAITHLKRRLLALIKRAPDTDIGYRLTDVRDLPFSRFSDSIKSVRTAINLATKSRPLHTIGITSSMPKEGKSTFASNLATLYSIANSRVLIVDADVHNSTISRVLAPERDLGLIEAITGVADVSKCIVPRGADGPAVLPISANKQAVDSSDLLGSEAMRLLVERLREDYDLIIFDLPPLKPVVDGLALCPLLDAVILVAEWGGTPVPLLTEAIHDLRRASASLLGLVLTKVEERSEDHYSKRIRSGDYAIHA